MPGYAFCGWERAGSGTPLALFTFGAIAAALRVVLILPIRSAK